MSIVYVGTSGWAYSWNKDNSLEWYVSSSGLNAVELNMSFYRFPYLNQVKSWFKKADSLAWVVKVHRSITHQGKLKESIDDFQRFRSLFTPLEGSVHYYLMQFPSSFKDLDTLEYFVNESGCDKLAVELRNPLFFTDEVIRWSKKVGVLLVSVDAPNLPSTIMSSETVYMRIHGRGRWYSYNYSESELKDIEKRINSVKPRVVYVFFNNDHEMLKNAQLMYKILVKNQDDQRKGVTPRKTIS